MSRKRTRSQSPVSQSTTPSTSTQLFRSSPIEDRSSKFIALYSPTLSAKALQAHSDFKSASHRIAAWRKPSSQGALPFQSSSQRLYDSGHDDDGEKYAGNRLEKVLADMNAEGAVVVARWFGGVMLGPVRFNHIEHCARDSILESRRAETRHSAEDQAQQKQRKIDEGERNRAALMRTLEERDQSITVLRGLLREKIAASVESSETASDFQRQTPTKKIDYSAMPLQALKQLDKARDATIAWILKEIDKAEERQKVIAEAK
jgi:putative IMPACT (imprinted ancient) family translation regulator